MQKNDENKLDEIVVLPVDIDSIEEKKNSLTLKALREQEESQQQKNFTPENKTEESDQKKTKEKKEVSSKRDPFKGVFFILFFLIMSGSFYYMYIITNRLNNLDQELFQKTISLDRAVLKHEERLSNLTSIQDSVNKLTLFQKSIEEINGKNDSTFKWLIQTIDELKAKISLMEAITNNLGQQKKFINESSENITNKEVETLAPGTNSGIPLPQTDKIGGETIEQLVDKGVATQLAKHEQKQKTEAQKKREEKTKLIKERNRNIVITMEGIARDIFELFRTLYLYAEKNIVNIFKTLKNQFDN